MTPKETDHKDDLVHMEALRRVQQDEYTHVELRDQVLSQMNDYCAGLSEELWHHYTNLIQPHLLLMEWNDDLHFRYLELKRLIDRQGIEGAGELVFNGLLEILAQKQ